MPPINAQNRRRNRVFKSLHKPLTYLGVERGLFFLICVMAVAVFNLFNSLLAALVAFLGGFAIAHWLTGGDPAFLRILGRAERYKARYDAHKQQPLNVEVL
jgi:type IV secretory pathway TrbD component